MSQGVEYMRIIKQATYRVYWLEGEHEKEKHFTDKFEMLYFCTDILAKNKIHYGIDKTKGNKINNLKRIVIDIKR